MTTINHYERVIIPPLHPTQKQIYDSIIAGQQFTSIAAGRRYGKAQKLTEPILTPKGWKVFGDLRVGDEVFGADGKPTKIVRLSPIEYSGRMLEVSFSDGSKVAVHENHEWLVHSKHFRKNKARNANAASTPAIIETKEIQKQVKLSRNDGKIEYLYAVPVAAPLEFEEQNLPVDPYVLGVWLGDGSSSNAQISQHPQDAEIFQYFTGYTVRQSRAHDQLWNVSGGLKVALRELGVLDSKHIPENYLVGSYNQRLALLQGLMDTDGYVSKTGHCEFSGNETLAKAVYQLVVSMGIKATIHSRTAVLYGVPKGVNYRVFFTTTLPVFRLKRKLNRLPKKIKTDTGYRFIVAVREVDFEPCRCIEVDNDSHLYLTGNSLIPTHNSMLAQSVLYELSVNQGKRVWWVSPTHKQAGKQWRIAKRMLRDFYTEKFESDKRMHFDYLNPTTGEEMHGEITFLSSTNPDNLRGDSLDFVIVDEAAFCDPEVWRILRPALTDRSGGAMFISTPKGLNWFYKLWMGGGEPNVKPEGKVRWRSWQYTSYDNPFIPPEEIDDAKNGMQEWEFNTEHLAIFGESDTKVFKDVYKASVLRMLENPEPDAQYIIGVDLARRRDYTVVAIIDRNTGKQVRVERWQNMAFPLQKQRLRRIFHKWKPVSIVIEENAVGVPIIEDLRQSTEFTIKSVFTGRYTKQPMIEALALAFEKGTIQLIDQSTSEGNAQYNELIAYEVNLTAAGNWEYGAPSGSNDDCVMALALCWTEMTGRMATLQSSANPFYAEARPAAVKSTTQPTGSLLERYRKRRSAVDAYSDEISPAQQPVPQGQGRFYKHRA